MRRRADGGEGVRRIGRYILNTSAAVSLILFVAMLVLWLRSRTHRDEICYTLPDRGVWNQPPHDERFRVTSASSRLVLTHSYWDDDPEAPKGRGLCEVSSDPWVDSGWELFCGRTGFASFGIVSSSGTFSVPSVQQIRIVPHWAVAALTALLPAWRAIA